MNDKVTKERMNKGGIQTYTDKRKRMERINIRKESKDIENDWMKK